MLTHCALLVLVIFVPSTEQAVKNDELDKKVASDQGSSRSDSPLPQQQPRQTENDTARRRKRKRQLKSKTYMNDEGFMGKYCDIYKLHTGRLLPEIQPLTI